MIAINIHLGAFHRVKAIWADQKYLSILDALGTEFLIPISSPSPTPVQIFGRFNKPGAAQGVMHLDHLEVPDVTRVCISSRAVSLETSSHIILSWKVFPDAAQNPARHQRPDGNRVRPRIAAA